jgi:PAS domain-containing protein
MHHERAPGGHSRRSTFFDTRRQHKQRRAARAFAAELTASRFLGPAALGISLRVNFRSPQFTGLAVCGIVIGRCGNGARDERTAHPGTNAIFRGPAVTYKSTATDRTNPLQHWTRELGYLRGRILKLRGRTTEPDGDDPTEAALTAADALLRELAGAQLECERLRAASHAQAAEWERTFDAMPCAWVITDRNGAIRDANGMAGALLNLSVRHLRGRHLLVHTENRKAFTELLSRLNSGTGSDEAVLKIRPRDRRAVEMTVTVTPAPATDSGDWLWYFVPGGSIAAVADNASNHLPGSTGDSVSVEESVQ